MKDHMANKGPAKQTWYRDKTSTMQTVTVTAEMKQMQKAIIGITFLVDVLAPLSQVNKL